ncbi:MAG: hypothetical protein WC694_03495 [Candidatus Paceibacterota bacterium]|jgi:hypothetical protein
MTSKLEKFLKQNKPLKKTSKLDIYRSEIVELQTLKFTQNQICEYLKEAHQIEVTRQYISFFLKNSVKEKEVQPPPPLKKELKDEVNPADALDNFFNRRN